MQCGRFHRETKQNVYFYEKENVLYFFSEEAPTSCHKREKFLSASPPFRFVLGCARLHPRLAVCGFPPPSSKEWESVLSEGLRVSDSGRSPGACDGKSTFLLNVAPLGRILPVFSLHPT
ncbi:hypothetical protein NPIL_249251 [Nephila pilipes]|uniref:Uncharacterized protein n=1 Tax=Nephila pilipes TaxID=299642 RepID=A0A8X6NBJ0_NEPPI|nr:hypothetical protein NPIL_249251 [Nephila pilipes]